MRARARGNYSYVREECINSKKTVYRQQWGAQAGSLNTRVDRGRLGQSALIFHSTKQARTSPSCRYVSGSGRGTGENPNLKCAWYLYCVGFIAGFHVSRGLQRALGVAGGLGGGCGCVCVSGGQQPSRSGGWRRAVRLSASRCAVRVVVVSVVVHVLRCADCCRARLMWQAAPAPQRGAAPRLQRSSRGCSSSCCSRVPWMPHSRLLALVSSSGGV